MTFAVNYFWNIQSEQLNKRMIQFTCTTCCIHNFHWIVDLYATICMDYLSSIIPHAPSARLLLPYSHAPYAPLSSLSHITHTIIVCITSHMHVRIHIHLTCLPLNHMHGSHAHVYTRVYFTSLHLRTNSSPFWFLIGHSSALHCIWQGSSTQTRIY